MNKPEVKINNWSIQHFPGKYFDRTTFILYGDAENHPYLGSQHVHTSQILSINFDTNVAETLNTRYLLGTHADD